MYDFGYHFIFAGNNVAEFLHNLHALTALSIFSFQFVVSEK